MTTTETPPDKSAGRTEWLSLVLTLSDTTWRIVVPTLGLAVLGLIGDLRYHTKPWLTLSGTLIGFIISARLIALQLKGTK